MRQSYNRMRDRYFPNWGVNGGLGVGGSSGGGGNGIPLRDLDRRGRGSDTVFTAVGCTMATTDGSGLITSAG